METFLAFLGVSAVVIATPGPDTAITIRNTLLGGRAGGAMTALGIASGQLVWALATSLGLVAILVASEPVFLAIKYAGAAYLVWLGLHSLHAAFQPQAEVAPDAGEAPVRRLTRARAFRQGLFSDLGNPKMAVFFASLLPQFVSDGQPTFSGLLTLGAVFAAMTFAWLAAYTLIVARAGDWLRRSAIRRAIEAATGVVMIGLGLRLAAEHR